MRSVNKFLPACSRGNDPPCFSVCPFEFDIREFITKLQRGSFDGAFRLFRDAVFFPGIVTALCARYCMTVCSERNGGAPVNMSLLEKSSLKLARSIDPPLLNIPSKNQSAAIVGAGICGLTCALRLASMNYQVTVYEVNDRFGGHLWDLLPEDVFVGDIERQFQHVKYRLNLRRKIDVLPELEEQYDAIFVATGKGGNVFGLTAKEKPSLAFDSRRGIIMGGEVVGSDILGAISHGSKAATMMERYFKTGAFTEDSSSADSFQPNMSVEVSYLSSDRDCPAYSKEEAVFEAKRCSKCDCDKCYVSCPYMRHYKKYPERIATDAHETVNPSTYIVKSLVATRMIASCSDCGLCGQKCPENIHLGNLLMRARQSLVEQGNLPPPFHAFFMRDFEFANSDVAALSMPGKEGSPCRMTFFPGCQMGASSPALVRQAYAYLLAIEPSTGLLLRCCGVPAYWSGESGEFSKNLDIIRSEWERMGNPTLVTACPTCARMIRENLEDIPSISIYEIMSESPPLSTAYCSDETFSIFDPCASRYFPEMQRSVRNLLKRLSIVTEELPSRGPEAICCSWGGHMRVANPTLVNGIKERSANLAENTYITYCMVCKEQFAEMNKQCHHIMEFFFHDAEKNQFPTLLSQKFNNRISLRRDLLVNFWQISDEKKTESRMRLIISQELKKKMSDELVLEHDIAEVISNAEANGSKLYFPDSGKSLAHMKIGHITYWAEYRPYEDGYLLINSYSHRMTLDKDGNDAK